MYTAHYGLKTKPFSIVPDPNILFMSKSHENALTYLEYGLSQKLGFILLTGEVGTGKTTLIRHVLNRLPAGVDIAVIFNTNITSEQLLRRILSELELPCDTADKSLHVETLYHFLIEQYARGRHTLLIIDEAQNLSDEVLEDIRMLFNLQTDCHVLLQVILVGQPDLKRRMDSPALRQLAQRVVVSYHLTPLSHPQTHPYINYRLQAAGATTELFSAEAIALIHERSGGIPRTINLLCDAGLVYAYGENKPLVDRTIVENVLKDRICLTAATHAQPVPADAAPAPDEAAGDLLARIAAVEAGLADLKAGQEMFVQTVRSELDQALGVLAAGPAGDTAATPAEKALKATAAHMDPGPAPFAFTDSAVGHALEFEREHHFHGDVGSDARYPFGTAGSRPKPDLLKMTRKRILPYLDQAYTWIRRSRSRRYAAGIILLLLPVAGLWAMMGGEERPPAHYADPAEDAAPPAQQVSLNYEEALPAPGIAHNRRRVKTAQQAHEGAEIIHTIRSGETLLTIARHYGVSAESIKIANHLANSHLIYVGQTLTIPSP